MIAGIGADLIEISRIRDILEKPTAEQFLARVLTPAERELVEQRRSRLVEYIAGRFAAKESVAKALGTGIGAAVGFHDIQIMCDQRGKPYSIVSPEALSRAGYDQPVRIHLTITHTAQTAAAFAVLEIER